MPKIIPSSLWKRFGAFVFDILIIEFVLLYPFTSIAERAAKSIDASFITFEGPLIGLIFSVAAIYILYFALFEYYLGQTVGKMLMKIKSVSLTGKKMSFWQAICRNLFLLPVIPFILLWIIDPIFIIWKKISFSEILTKTATVEEDVIWKIK